MGWLSDLLPALDPVLTHGSGATLSILLLLGGWAKLRDVARFEGAVAQYRLLPERWAAPVARVLPALELLAGALLLPLPLRPAGALLALALLSVVSVAMAINLARGHVQIDCGCGGTPTPLSPALLLRNALLALMALLAANTSTGRDMAWLDVAAIAGGAVFCVGLYHLAEALLAQQARLSALRQRLHS